MRGHEIPRYVQPPDVTYNADHPTHYEEAEPYAQEYKYPEDEEKENLASLVTPEPIAVTVVSTPRSPRTVTSFLATQVVVNFGTRYAIKRDDNRTRLHLINLDAAKSLMVMNNDGAINATNGYPLGPGKELEITSTREVFIANPDAAANVSLGIYAENVLELT